MGLKAHAPSVSGYGIAGVALEGGCSLSLGFDGDCLAAGTHHCEPNPEDSIGKKDTKGH